MDIHQTQLLKTLSFEKHWANPKTDVVDPHRTKNRQNAPSWSGGTSSKEGAQIT